MSYYFRSIFLIATIAACFAADAVAQVERILPRKGASSLEGTQFVIGFMQNEILEIGIDPRLQIFIASQHDAIVTIDFPDYGPRVIRIPANTVHVEGVTASHMVSSSEVPEQKGIFISSDVPIVVYVLNTLATSTDSYSAIPIKHLGTQYLTMNRGNDHYALMNNNDPWDTATRSGEFMIIATENFTKVTITPRARTEGGYPADQAFSVTLNKGECYQVQSIHTPIGTSDLTGSRIDADRPIAVLSGHMRTSIPTVETFFKDHLVEMLPPISHWGKSYVTTPFALVENGDFIRVMAADYDTNIEIVTSGGSNYCYLSSPGDWREYRVTDVALWKSDKPFFVAQFMPSSNGSFNPYDPAMVVVPPTEVYIDAALFQFPTLDKQSQLNNQVFAYYINVVADSIALPTLRVNQTLVTDLAPSISTQRVPGTNMFWAQVKLQPGVYTIASNEGLFSGVMYGTTRADSYANLFGVGYDPPVNGDHTPPLYELVLNCGDIKGIVRDSAVAGPLLNEITVQTQRTFNYRWVITLPIDPTGKVEVDASVRDLWFDAQIVFHAYDDKGNGREWLYFYDAPYVNVPVSATITSLGNTTSCIKVPVVNSDSTSVRIVSVSFVGDARLSLGGAAIKDYILPAGDTLFVSVCYKPTADTTFAKGDVIVEYPCGLKNKCAIRVSGSASLDADSYDFGNVRVGDTACAMVPIFNNGTLPVSVDSLLKGIGGGDFTVITVIPTLPLMLLPGDSVWVQVCFTPMTLGAQSRDDTVKSKVVDGALVQYTGRGIRPEIRDIIIDFKDRKVGTNADTVFPVHNYGEARCSVSFGTRIVNEPAFTFGTPSLPADIIGGDLAVVSARFSPTARGDYADTIPMVTDWRFHEAVRLIIKGRGILPDVITTNIDFGNVVVNNTKDTTDTVVVVGGNSPLNIYALRISGPDAASFTIPASITGIKRLSVDSSITDLITFSPTRIGPHRCVVEFDHDARSGNLLGTSYIILTGVGVPIPVTNLAPRLIASAVMPACEKSEVKIVIENNGTTDITIDTVTADIAGLQYIVLGGYPFVLSSGQSRTLTTVIEPDRNSGTHLVVVVNYNGDQASTVTHDFSIPIQSPVVTSAGMLDGAPGNVVSFDVSAVSTQVRTVPEPFVVRVTADRNRWSVKTDAITALVTDASSSDAMATLNVAVQTDGAILTLDRTIQSPYNIRFAVAGDVLWRDPANTPINFAVQPTNCANEATSSSELSVDLCAGALRMVRFATSPMVVARIVKNPADPDLEIEFVTSQTTKVNLWILSTTGQRFSIAYNYPLQKGVTNCNFSSSAWASGLFWLLVQHENGESVVPVLFVK